MKTAW